MNKAEKQEAVKRLDAAIKDMEGVRDQVQNSINTMKQMRDTLSGQTKLKAG